ncbi:MAG: aldo/keto reductase [Firmicutes bacterium]|nr:aldo/keto reductase [Bacillota bacterium]
MYYTEDRYGHKVSRLGFGCMRFKRSAGSIDVNKAEKEIMDAIGRGVNYFDTAYIYPGSEDCLGEVLERNGARDKVFIATKLPQYLIKNRSAAERYFKEELKRLRTDHVDFYLMHMLTDVKVWNNLCALGIRDWIEEKKASGAIGQIGFSFHGNTAAFKEILEAYDWDFCQIQYNYVDEHTQAGRAGLEAARERGIPVVIMEPLRGGKLVTMLPQKAKDLIAERGGGLSPQELAFRWLYDQEGIMTVLSGMNSLEMVEDNCRIAERAAEGKLGAEEMALIADVKAEIARSIKVPCTGCGYCMPCPHGVDIPGAFRCYNRMFTESKSSGRGEYMQSVGLRKEKSVTTQCVGCGRCEKHCPQHIEIIKELKNAGSALMPLPRRIALEVARRFLMHGKG